MDKRTQLAAIAALAKSAAEVAADIATTTSEAAGVRGSDFHVAQNLIVGTLLPAEQQLDTLQSIFRAIHALHTCPGV